MAISPVLTHQTATQSWIQGESVSFTLPGNIFTDPQHETLSYSATLANGAALPSWLKFNAATGTFTGTVPVGSSALSIKVTATDTGGASASEIFSVLAPAAAPPIISAQTASQSWIQGQSVSFTLASNTFTDPQHEALTYTATLASGAALPSWLKFNAATGTFTGIVPVGSSALSIKVTATDTGGASTSETFAVLAPAAAPPVVAAQTANQSWIQGQRVSFMLSGSTFTDPQHEALTYSATLASGAALPSWLTFNAATETFTGTVPAGASGLSIKVTATDTGGKSTSETFSVVTPVPPPTVTDQTATQSWIQGQTVSLTLPANTFTDPQHETLSYAATLASGAALPSWLKFNAAIETFTGTVPKGAAGLSLKVTATDSGGASTSEIFSVLTPAPAPPAVTDQTPTQTWKQGQAVSLVIPGSTFTDPQREALTYSATLASGAALPSWLSFNAATETFSGTVPTGTAGLSIKLTATDSGGASNSETFSVLTPATASAAPMRASDFLSTLGVNTHVPYTDGGYVNIANVAADLKYLGITQVRDTISNGANGSAPLSSYIALAEQGIKFTFFLEASTTATLNTELGWIDQVNEAVPGSVTAVEGPNEINNWPVTFNGVGGLQGAINLQKAIYADVHSDPNLVGVSVDYFTGYDAGSVANGPDPATTPGLADFDTQHPYPNGQAPAAAMNPANSLPNEASGSGPFVYTETGYSTNGGTGGAVNADVQAKYTLDLLMDAAKDGSSKTYLYQLMDAYQPGSPQGDDGYGLFNPSNLPKEAATAIHDLTAILADTGANAATFTATPLHDVVTGLPSTGNSLVMEKSSGAYDIVVWNEPNIWNRSTGTEIAAPTVNVGVQLGATYSEVEVFDPLTGSAPIQILSNVSSVQLGLTDHPLIIEIEPAPVVSNATASQTWTQGKAVNFALPGNTFTDPQAQAMTYAATLSNGAALPSWLSFHASTDTFTGTVPTGTAALSIKVAATDASGFTGSETFAVSIAAAASNFAQAIAGSGSNGGAATATLTPPPPTTTPVLASPVH